jgi:uncharacterized protein (TIGR02996 family)
MNHPDWAALVAAIVRDPDEDTPRLVAADFLDENGDAERAAFVRAQVALARLEASWAGGSPEADELRKKERAFLGPFSVYPHLWAAEECPELVRVVSGRSGAPRTSLHVEGVDRLRWRRGFVEGVSCPAAEWLRHGVAVRARNPVRQVLLADCGQVTRDTWYAGLAALCGLREVWIGWSRERDLVPWLQHWLPGTPVELIPF